MWTSYIEAPLEYLQWRRHFFSTSPARAIVRNGKLSILSTWPKEVNIRRAMWSRYSPDPFSKRTFDIFGWKSNNIRSTKYLLIQLGTDACHAFISPQCNFHNIPWSSPGCRTGNGGKQSNSWFDGLTWLCLAAAYILSISNATSWGR